MLRWMLVTLFAFALVLPVGCDNQSASSGPGASSGESNADSDGPMPDQSLPTADVETLQKLVDDTAAQNKVLVLDFWATWCAPCTTMFGTVHEGVKQIPDARPASVTIDGPSDEAKAVRFLQRHEAMKDAYILAQGPDKQSAVVDAFADDWTNLSVPAIFIFDKQGNLAAEFIGAADPEETAKKIVSKALRVAGQSADSNYEPVPTKPDKKEIKKLEEKARQKVKEGEVSVKELQQDGQDGGSDNESGL